MPLSLDLATYNHLQNLVATAKRRLARETRSEIEVFDAPELMDALLELTGWGTSVYGDDVVHELGFPPSTITKFTKMRGKVRTQVARKLVDRLGTYLRSNEPAAPPNNRSVPDALAGHDILPEKPLPKKPELVIKAIEWKVVEHTDEIQEKIARLIFLIEDVTRHVATSNLPLEDRALTPIERAQLIAVLETALNILKSPMIEKGLLKKAGNMVTRAAGKAIEKQTEIAFSAAGSMLGTAIIEFLKLL